MKWQILDFEQYRKKYGNIRRLDRILKAEGDSPDKYQLNKQADVCMLFYVIPKVDLVDIFHDLGYDINDNMILDNINFYLERTR